MSLRACIKVGFGDYLGRFYQQIVADTPALQEFTERGLAKAMAWSPGKMIDRANDMLALWRKNQLDSARRATSACMPVVLVAMSSDFTPSMDWGRSIGSALPVISPHDPYLRYYQLQCSSEDIRTQMVVMAADPDTANSLVRQFHLWSSAHASFAVRYPFAGLIHEFDAALASLRIGATGSQLEADNLTILIMDVEVHANVPIFHAPGPGQANDGKAVPAGYPLLAQIDTHDTTAQSHFSTVLAPQHPLEVSEPRQEHNE